MLTRGLEGTELLIKDGKQENKSQEDSPLQITGEELSELVKILAEAERLIGVLNRRGIFFDGFIENYYAPSKGGLPQFRVCVNDEEEI